jgi:hypothetical protein
MRSLTCLGFQGVASYGAEDKWASCGFACGKPSSQCRGALKSKHSDRWRQRWNGHPGIALGLCTPFFFERGLLLAEIGDVLAGRRVVADVSPGDEVCVRPNGDASPNRHVFVLRLLITPAAKVLRA